MFQFSDFCSILVVEVQAGFWAVHGRQMRLHGRGMAVGEAHFVPLFQQKEPEHSYAIDA